MGFQVVGQRDVNRALHVWRKLNGEYKCVLCGGVVRIPDDVVTVERVELLTKEERDSCPPKVMPKR